MEQSPEMPCAISRLHVMGKIKMHTQYNLYRKHLVTSQQIKISFSYVYSFHCTQLCCTNLWSNDVHTTCWLNQCSFPIPYRKRFTLYMWLCFKHTTPKCGCHTINAVSAIPYCKRFTLYTCDLCFKHTTSKLAVKLTRLYTENYKE
jgi:hypothetical protein